MTALVKPEVVKKIGQQVYQHRRRRSLSSRLTEAQFQAQILEWAKSFKWLPHAERAAQYQSGRWATHIQGQPGFPDLVLCRPPRLIFAELKVGRNKTSISQDLWLEMLALCPGVEVYLWRPEAWSQILVTLSKP